MLCKQLWQTVLEEIAEHPKEVDVILDPLLRAAEDRALPNSLESTGGELDATIGNLLVQGLDSRSGSSEALVSLKRVLLFHRELPSCPSGERSDSLTCRILHHRELPSWNCVECLRYPRPARQLVSSQGRYRVSITERSPRSCGCCD